MELFGPPRIGEQAGRRATRGTVKAEFSLRDIVSRSCAENEGSRFTERRR